MYHLSPCIVALPNKRVQSDAAAAAGYRGENWLCNALRSVPYLQLIDKNEASKKVVICSFPIFGLKVVLSAMYHRF